jgi:hypothetical protein
MADFRYKTVNIIHKSNGGCGDDGFLFGVKVQ